MRTLRGGKGKPVPTELGQSFGVGVLRNYSAMQQGHSEMRLSEGLLASAAEIKTGHPMAMDLQVGQQKSLDMASVFLDLSQFTSRTFWEEAEDVASLAHAVLSGFTDVVQKLGGHVLGLRGDGLLAGFGPVADPCIAVSAASMACAAALDAVQTILNPQLKLAGMQPVVARAGADYGTAVFVKSGNEKVNEVNVIGFATNFAAKCEKKAAAWEMVVGEGLAAYIQDHDWLREHDDSPKRYTRNYLTESYSFYKFSWPRALSEVDGAVDELQGNPLEMIQF